MISQRGNALFLILIAVALFAALSYAVTNSGRGGGGIEKEQAKIDAAVNDQCNASVDAGRLRLTTLGQCSEREISYELSDGNNKNPAAPVNKSCHIFDPAGAGVAECGAYLLGENPCMQALAIGESCNGVVYAGMSGGNRIYTTPSDQGLTQWAGGGSYNANTGATNAGDGIYNTDILVNLSGSGSPFRPAQNCRALGEKWYLPAINESVLFYSNRDAIGGFSTDDYWTSTQAANHAGLARRMTNGSAIYATKNNTESYRCVRRD